MFLFPVFLFRNVGMYLRFIFVFVFRLFFFFLSFSSFLLFSPVFLFSFLFHLLFLSSPLFLFMIILLISLFSSLSLFISVSLFTHRNWINQSNDSTNEERSCTSQERAINLSLLSVSGPGEFSHVESNWAAGSTLGGALPEPTNIDLSEGAEGVIKQTTPQSQVVMLYGWNYDGTSMSSVSFVPDQWKHPWHVTSKTTLIWTWTLTQTKTKP